MSSPEYEDFESFKEAWESVDIVRPVQYSLFTFGDSDLPYFLICSPGAGEVTVTIRRGEIRITRPMIITAENASPEFLNFFEDEDQEAALRFLLSRTASFPNLKFNNTVMSEQIVSDSVEEAAARINRQLDKEEEDRIAVLTAPPGLGGFAILRYSLERVMKSAPDNLNELRERGLLPDF